MVPAIVQNAHHDCADDYTRRAEPFLPSYATASFLPMIREWNDLVLQMRRGGETALRREEERKGTQVRIW